MQGSASGRNSRGENGVETRSFAFHLRTRETKPPATLSLCAVLECEWVLSVADIPHPLHPASGIVFTVLAMNLRQYLSLSSLALHCQKLRNCVLRPLFCR